MLIYYFRHVAYVVGKKYVNNKMFYLCGFSVSVISMGTWYHLSASALLH